MKDNIDIVVTSWRIPRFAKRAIAFVTAALGYDSESKSIAQVAELAKKSVFQLGLINNDYIDHSLLEVVPNLIPHVIRPLSEIGMSAKEMKEFLEKSQLSDYVMKEARAQMKKQNAS